MRVGKVDMRLGSLPWFGLLLMWSTIHGDFLGTDKSLVILRCPLTLQVLESARAKSAIVMVLHGRAAIVADEMVLLHVPRAQEFESSWVRVVADRFQDHVVTLSDGHISNVLHRLNEGQSASVCPLGLLLEVHGESILVVQVVASPELHGEDPEEAVLCHTTPDVRHIVEKFRASVLIEVPVAEHGWMSIEILHSWRAPLDWCEEALSKLLSTKQFQKRHSS